MMPIRKTGIVIVGDEDLVNGMRLGGISRYTIVEQGPDTAREVRQTLNHLIADEDVSVIVIQEDYAEHVSDLIERVRLGERMTPIIVEVPSKHGTKYGDVRGYYRNYARGFIGFDIEI